VQGPNSRTATLASCEGYHATPTVHQIVDGGCLHWLRKRPNNSSNEKGRQPSSLCIVYCKLVFFFKWKVSKYLKWQHFFTFIGSKKVGPAGERWGVPGSFFQEDDPKASSPEKAVKNMLARSVLEGHPAPLEQHSPANSRLFKLYENSGQWYFFFAVFFLLPLIGAMQTRRSRVLFELQLAWAEQTTCPLHGSTKATSNWNCWNSSMHASCGLASILFETLFLTQELPSNPRFSENPSLLVCARLSWQWLQDVARLDQFSCQNCFERQMEDNIIALLSTL